MENIQGLETRMEIKARDSWEVVLYTEVFRLLDPLMGLVAELIPNAQQGLETRLWPEQGLSSQHAKTVQEEAPSPPRWWMER